MIVLRDQQSSLVAGPGDTFQVQRGGRGTWMNGITACRSCKRNKGWRLPGAPGDAPTKESK